MEEGPSQQRCQGGAEEDECTQEDSEEEDEDDGAAEQGMEGLEEAEEPKGSDDPKQR